MGNLRELKYKAFTMAEAILVMVILGIIATIMISNMKPSEFRDKALRVQAKKVLGQIDSATNQILFNDTTEANFNTIIKPSDKTQVSITTSTDSAITTLGQLYKKYLVAQTRFSMNSDTLTELTKNNYPSELLTYAARSVGGINVSVIFKLKDESFFLIGKASEFSTIETIFPDEVSSCKTSTALGYIIYDVNGYKEAPNIYGKDIWVIPINASGIAYDASCN